MAKKKSGGGGIAVVIGFVVLVLFSMPKAVWIGAGLLVAVYLLIRLFAKQDSSAPLPVIDASSLQATQPHSPPSYQTRGSRESDNLTTIDAQVGTTSTRHVVPPAPKGYGAASWIPTGTSVYVQGLEIPGGLLYFGTNLKSKSGTSDPSLVDPSKSVAAHGDFTERHTNYWPSYSEINPTARRAYLNWIVDGRKHPEADIGYVFLHFYGLERRAILDGAAEPSPETALPEIAQELRRLLSIYGEKSHSFQSYGSALLSWVELGSFSTKLYGKPIPEMRRGFELPLHLRLALGQAALDGAPMPAQLALAWIRNEPDTYLRTPATRCSEQFEKLFISKYTETYGQGLLLPKNKTKLKFVYRPASSGFHGYGEIKLTFGETPDVSVLTGPVNKLRLIVESATKELDAYSRYLGRNPEAGTSLEGLLQLPTTLWPDSALKALLGLKERMGADMLAISFQELLSTLEAQTALTKDKVLGLARALESLNIAMEPDVLGGAKTPKPDETVVLFAVQTGEPIVRNSPAYQAALLTLQLASAVAAADGDFSAEELGHLRKQVEAWTHLTPSHRQRLLAHLRLLLSAPVSLPALKKKLEPLEMSAKEAIAAFMATVAQADGVVLPAEVKMLEKVYKALGVESKKVFSDIHAAASGAVPVAKDTATAEVGFKLDPAKIAALQRDTEKVSAMLAGIFNEIPATDMAVEMGALEVDATEQEPTAGILGLDEAHSALARTLLLRPEWSRQELQDVADDLELMLDGALERINEASFDAYDLPLTEGDDPIGVRSEVLEKLEA
jgi:tellurite resistance protein